MTHTRFFNPAAFIVLAGAAALALILALQPARTLGKAGPEALAIYHASERSRAEAALTGGAAVDSLGLSPAGRAAYAASERERVPATLPARAERLWLAIYHASEWDRLVPVKWGLGAAGLAAYSASEHTSAALSAGNGLAAEGLRLYHASEQSRAAAPGAQMNAYQRSEWLGADR